MQLCKQIGAQFVAQMILLKINFIGIVSFLEVMTWNSSVGTLDPCEVVIAKARTVARQGFPAIGELGSIKTFVLCNPFRFIYICYIVVHFSFHIKTYLNIFVFKSLCSLKTPLFRLLFQSEDSDGSSGRARRSSATVLGRAMVGGTSNGILLELQDPGARPRLAR